MTWSVVPLREVADVLRGVTYKKEQARDRAATGHVPLLRATNIGDSLDLSNGLIYVPESVVKASQRLQSGDIVLASSSGSLSVVGKSAPLRHTWDGTFGAFCAVIRSSPRVDAGYLSLYLRSQAVRSRWSEAARGTNINNLKRGDLDETPVPVPPLDEQRRIVDLLEEHLSRLDAADQLLSKQRKLASGLASLCAHQATTTLIGDSKPLGAMSLFITDGDHNPPKRVSEGVPHVTARGIRPDGSIDLHAGTYVTEEGFRQTARRYMPSGGDVIVTCVGTIGRLAVVQEGARFSADRNLAAIRLDPSEALPEYVELALRGTGAQLKMARASGSTAQPHLYLKDLRRLPVKVPSLAEQRAIVARASEQLSGIRLLESEVDRATRRSAILRRSLLAAAFSGRLTGSASDLSVTEEMIRA